MIDRIVATISKDFNFSASHQLEGLADGHQCGRVHGHNYIVRAVITGEVDDLGMVVDYGELKAFGQMLDHWLDHRHLNDVAMLGGRNPTAENLAAALVLQLRDCLASVEQPLHALSVSVSETPKTWATVTASTAAGFQHVTL